MLNGTEEDHAILLHNYLCHLDHRVYLVMGLAIPEGQTAQVLYREKDTDCQWLINAVTGRRTDVRDSSSSLHQVWALLDRENVVIISYFKKTLVDKRFLGWSSWVCLDTCDACFKSLCESNDLKNRSTFNITRIGTETMYQFVPF